MTLKQAKKELALRRQNVRETLTLIEANPDTDLFDGQLRDMKAEVARLSQVVVALMPRTVIAIDPAMRRSGIAVRDVEGGEVRPGFVDGAENIAAAMGLWFTRPLRNGETVYLVVEYPTWKGKGTNEVRAAANCWIRAFKAAFPRRLKVRKVTPQTWMSDRIPGYRKLDKDAGERPADMYVPLAKRLLMLDASDAIDENAAAAVCILAWAENQLELGTFSPAKAGG